jgi:glycosyltransferase involved in cell wall biosynthesis
MFEYMAAGLPVVAPAVARIPQLVAGEREGILYDPAGVPPEGGSSRGEGHAEALAGALERLTDPELRARLGAAARVRAEREYSWAAHCRALSDAFT